MLMPAAATFDVSAAGRSLFFACRYRHIILLISQRYYAATFIMLMLPRAMPLLARGNGYTLLLMLLLLMAQMMRRAFSMLLMPLCLLSMPR